MADSREFDIVVIGGGLAGLTLSKQLLDKQPNTKILILEKRTFPVPEAAFKVGESTVEIGAHYLAEGVGLKKHLVDQQLPKFGLRFFFNNGQQTLSEATEVGTSEFFPAPGYQVDRGRLENYLSHLVRDMGAVLLSPASLTDVELTEGKSLGHRVHFKFEGQDHTAESRWVVDASGRTGFLKRKLGIAKKVEHNVNAIWFRIGAELRIDEWCSDSTWQARIGKVPRRWLSTNHLLGRGYWVWIIPLASGATSIGIVADPRLHPLSELNQFEKALAWLEKNEPLLAESIHSQRERIQDFSAIKHLAHSSSQVFSSNRWALTGEAGVFLDPLYSPGIDYIAMGNTMICKLIESDLAGLSLNPLAERLNNTFLTLFQNNLLTYDQQYPLFGNPRIMSLKYVWDYTLYWGFPALLYFRDKLSDPAFLQGLGPQIKSMRDANQQMQQFFRDWDEHDSNHDVDSVFIDQHEIGLLTQLNAELKDELDDTALKARFMRNESLIRELMAEIIGKVSLTRPGLATPGSLPSPTQSRLEGVFELLNI